MSLPLWTIYEHPHDFPNNYVARLWNMDQPSTTIIVTPDLETLREQMMEMHLTPIPRWADDDPCIVEVWV